MTRRILFTVFMFTLCLNLVSAQGLIPPFDPVTSNISTFLELTDTPGTYSGQAGLVATVNPGETALIFSAGGGGGGITNISQAGDVDVSGIADDDVLKWDDAVKQFIVSRFNSILSFGNDYLFFSGDNEISFNETKLNDTIDDRQTNISILHGANESGDIKTLLTTSSGVLRMSMTGEAAASGIWEKVGGVVQLVDPANDVIIDADLDVNGAINITGIPDGSFTCYTYNSNGGCMFGGNSTCNIQFSTDGLSSQEICN